MIHTLVKTIAIDGFFTEEQATHLCNVTYELQYVDTEFGKEIANFEMIPVDADQLFSHMLGTTMNVDHNRSGIFRIPTNFIHFESFDDYDEWMFAVALQNSTFNIFEHCSGCKNALEGHKHNYRNLFEWDLTTTYQLKPGHGILFRPWLFHSFDNGQIQIFRLREINDN